MTEESLVARLRNLRDVTVFDSDGYCYSGAPGGYLSALLREAADALERAEKEREQTVTDMQANCERHCEEARERGDEPAAYLFEGGIMACEAILAKWQRDPIEEMLAAVPEPMRSRLRALSPSTKDETK